MLILLLIGCILQKEILAANCKLAATVSEAATVAHNSLRAKVAQRDLDKNIYGDLPVTKSLFKLEYDCTHEELASAVIGSDCKHSSVYVNVIGKGENFITYKTNSIPGKAKLATMFGWAVEDRGNTVENPLSADVRYIDTTMEPFANIIYNKTLKFGCSYLYCDTTSKVAIACVYEERQPQEGEPLYSADSTGRKGCTTNSPCKNILKGAVCDNNDGIMGPLCEQKPPATTTSTLSTTASTTISTTTSTTTSTATDESSQKESSEVTTIASTDLPRRYVLSIKNGPETKTFFEERHKCL